MSYEMYEAAPHFDEDVTHIAHTMGRTARFNFIARRCNHFFRGTNAWQQWNYGWDMAHKKMQALLQSGGRVSLRWMQ